MEYELKKALGKENYERLEKFLKDEGIYGFPELYKKSPVERIEIIKKYASETGEDFTSIYGKIEEIKEKRSREAAFRSAVAAILSREGSCPISNKELYEEIKNKIEEGWWW